MENKIYNRDCMDIMQGMNSDSVDLLLTDIPYGGVNRKSNGLRNLDKKDADIFNLSMPLLVKEMVRVTKGSGYIFCGWEQMSEIVSIIRSLGVSNRIIVWEKTNPSPMNGQSIWLSGIELAVYFKKKNATYKQHCKNVVVRFPCGRGKVHPTEKPLKLFKHFIEISSNEGDVVFDPFLGSGTSAVGAIELNRKYIGVELNPEYAKIAQNRIDLTVPQITLL
jgi:site-specific DNA-methyltransferase (adenine-specific)